MDRKAWSSTVREAAESQTTLSTSIYLYLQLINVVLVSGVQQKDSVTHIPVSILQILFPFGLLRNIEHILDSVVLLL